MTRIPIQLDFNEVLLTFTGNMFGPHDILKTLEGEVHESTRFRRELVKQVRKIPADISRIDVLGQHGIAKYDFDKDGIMSNYGTHISGLGPFYLITYNGGVLDEGNLIPNAGQVFEIKQGYKDGMILPIYRIDMGTCCNFDEVTEEDMNLPYEKKFDKLRNIVMGMGEGIDEFAEYFVKSQDAINLYHDYNRLREQKILFEG